MCFYLSLQFRIIVSKQTCVGMLQLCQFLSKRKNGKQNFTIQCSLPNLSTLKNSEQSLEVITTVKQLKSLFCNRN